MARQSYNTMADAGGAWRAQNYRILVIGKTGNGKSSACNAILGTEKFTIGRSMASTTLDLQEAVTVKDSKEVKVVDTPDVSNLEGMTSQKIQEEISKWQTSVLPFPSAVLLTVRCDVRYTPEEYALYRQIKLNWGDKNFLKRLVVVFTFGDRQDNPIDEELKTVCPELKNVLKDANKRYVVFDKTKQESVGHFWSSLVRHMQDMDASESRLQQFCIRCYLCCCRCCTDE